MTQSSRALRGMTSELWAIEPSWIPMLAAIAQRNQSAPEIEAAKEWTQRDFSMIAGPGAQKLPGAYRAFVVQGIAIIPITGPIFPRANLLTEMSGATSLSLLANDYQAALNNKSVNSILLVIDSPGGAVSGIADFAAQVVAGNRRKETASYVTGVAASAAYWIASVTSRISIDRTAMLGSIGVVAVVPKQVQPGDDGYVTVEIVSSNAPNKRPDPQSDDGQNLIRGSLDAIERVFITDVAGGRKVNTTKVTSDFGRGGLLVGSSAVAAGMADKVESQRAAMNNLLVSANSLGGRCIAASQHDQNAQRLAALADPNRAAANRARLAALRR